jgi:NAD(P)-dependent dehydrogenase (short-subunit alcohol dehydrogenase family)
MTRTVFITGVTSGIGHASAIRFARGGWNVIGLGRRAERLNRLRSELGEQMAVLPADIRDLAGVKEAMASLPARFRDLDLLVNNAGTTTKELVQNARLDDLNAIIDTNIRAAVGLTWLLLPMLPFHCLTAHDDHHPRPGRASGMGRTRTGRQRMDRHPAAGRRHVRRPNWRPPVDTPVLPPSPGQNRRRVNSA